MEFDISHLDNRLDETRISLLRAGVELMRDTYGPDSLHPLPYHDDRHALEVIEACATIGDAVSLDPRTFGNLLVAAAFHDAVHDSGPENEEKSAQIALQHMDAYPGVFHEADRQQVASIIMATKILLRDGKFLQLTFVEPQEVTLAHKVIADADLSNVGRPPSVFWERALDFFKENNPDTPITNRNLVDYAAAEMAFLQNHKFWLPESEAIFSHKQTNLEYLSAVQQTGQAA